MPSPSSIQTLPQCLRKYDYNDAANRDSFTPVPQLTQILLARTGRTMLAEVIRSWERAGDNGGMPRVLDSFWHTLRPIISFAETWLVNYLHLPRVPPALGA